MLNKWGWLGIAIMAWEVQAFVAFVIMVLTGMRF